jgi:hypothetical protein
MGKAQFGSSLLHERPAFMTFLGQAQFELLLNAIPWGGLSQTPSLVSNLECIFFTRFFSRCYQPITYLDPQVPEAEDLPWLIDAPEFLSCDNAPCCADAMECRLCFGGTFRHCSMAKLHYFCYKKPI